MRFKKISVVILSFVFLFCILTPASIVANAETEYTSGIYTYTVSGGKATIKRCYTTASGTLSIPSTLGGYPVTTIGIEAFEIKNITNLIIPNNVTSICARAFWFSSSLKNVTIPPSVQKVDFDAFVYCDNLEGVYISDIAAWCSIEFASRYDTNPLYYANNLYLNNKLVTELTIPSGVTTIRSFTFEYCTSITSVSLPITLTTVEPRAFVQASSITSVKYEGSASQWSNIDFTYDNDYLEDAAITYNAIQNTYTFVTNGGSYVSPIKANVINSSPVTTKQCHTFSGWYNNSNLSGSRVSFPYSNTSKNILYAKWQVSHSFGAWTITKSPTCVSTGLKERTCTVCKTKETQTIAATGHSYNTEIVPPNCTEKGYTIYTCSICEYEYNSDFTEAIGHSKTTL